MVGLLQIASAASVVVIFVLASIIKSVKGGYLGNVIQEIRDNGEDLDSRLSDIQDTTHETLEKTDRNYERIEDLGEAVYLLHADDEDINESELREKVGVDSTGTDIFRGGEDIPGHFDDDD
jgi:hypothetical protein